MRRDEMVERTKGPFATSDTVDEETAHHGASAKRRTRLPVRVPPRMKGMQRPLEDGFPGIRLGKRDAYRTQHAGI